MGDEIEMRNGNENGRFPKPEYERAPDEGDSEEYVEPFHVPATAQRPKKLSRQFRGRQIQMMAISPFTHASPVQVANCIYLYQDGPVSLVLGYLWVGTIMYAVMITMGEMISLLPVPGGFFTLANRCLSPSLGFSCGWAYWFAQAISVAAQLVASAKIIRIWLPTVRSEIWVAVIFVVIFGFNNFNVRRYGEIEYWVTAVKVVTIMGIIFAGVILPMNASPNQRLLGTDADFTPVPCNQTASNFTCVAPPGFNYWRQEAFNEYLEPGNRGRFIGLWNSCCQAIFSFVGVELVGIAADECERQRTVLPKAVRRVSWRVIIYYVGAVTVLGLNLAPTDPILGNFVKTGQLTYTPFGLMFERAGIPVLRHIVDAVALLASASCANTALYLGSRTLYALAWEQQAPKIFLTKHIFDVPIWALILTAIPSGLAYWGVTASGGNSFDFFLKFTNAGSMASWSLICATYLRFRVSARRQPGVEDAIPVAAKSPLQPYLAIYGLTCSLILLILQGFEFFAKGNDYWAFVADDWGYYVAPWVAVGVILLLTLAYLGYEFSRNKSWSWLVPNLRKIDLHNGVAPEDVDEKPRLIDRILDAI